MKYNQLNLGQIEEVQDMVEAVVDRMKTIANTRIGLNPVQIKEVQDMVEAVGDEIGENWIRCDLIVVMDTLKAIDRTLDIMESESSLWPDLALKKFFQKLSERKEFAEIKEGFEFMCAIVFLIALCKVFSP